MWWTITGNFGNLLPIDWSKSYARQLQAKALNLGEKRVGRRLKLYSIYSDLSWIEINLNQGIVKLSAGSYMPQIQVD